MQQVPMDSSVAKATQKLKIAQVLISDAWGEIGFDKLGTGIGGRETAVLRLAEQWAIQGHHVEVFANVGAGSFWRPETGDGCVEFINAQAARTMLSTTYRDVIVSWEETSILALPEVVSHSIVRIVGMQVAHLLSLRPEHIPAITGYVCLSGWAADFLASMSDGMVDRKDVAVVPNGIAPESFPKRSVLGRSGTPKFIYSSSPDRGLVHLIDNWQQIRKAFPQATLTVAYGIDRWIESARWSHNIEADVARRVAQGIKQDGIINCGLIGQQQLADIQLQSTLMPYSCDTAIPTETGCITVTEALAAMCPVVTTDCDCLPSEYGEVAMIVPLPFRIENFIAAMSSLMDDPSRYVEMQVAGRKFALGRAWEKTSKSWIETIRNFLATAD